MLGKFVWFRTSLKLPELNFKYLISSFLSWKNSMNSCPGVLFLRKEGK